MERPRTKPERSLSKNEHTLRKTMSSIKRIRMFFYEVGETRPLEKIPPVALDRLLGLFFRTAKKFDGTDFEPQSLKSFQHSIERYLRYKHYRHNILLDSVFSGCRSVLLERKIELREMGKGNKPNSAPKLTVQEEEKMWSCGVLGSVNDPVSLQRTVWFFNWKLFGIKCNQEAYQLCWGDIQLLHEGQQDECLIFNERVCKKKSPVSNAGKTQKTMPRIWPNSEHQQRCPIYYYKEFARHRPKSTCLPTSPFYLSIKQNRLPEDQQFYKNCNLGIHSLERMLKIATQEASIIRGDVSYNQDQNLVPPPKSTTITDACSIVVSQLFLCLLAYFL